MEGIGRNDKLSIMALHLLNEKREFQKVIEVAKDTNHSDEIRLLACSFCIQANIGDDVISGILMDIISRHHDDPQKRGIN